MGQVYLVVEPRFSRVRIDRHAAYRVFHHSRRIVMPRAAARTMAGATIVALEFVGLRSGFYLLTFAFTLFGMLIHH